MKKEDILKETLRRFEKFKANENNKLEAKETTIKTLTKSKKKKKKKKKNPSIH